MTATPCPYCGALGAVVQVHGHGQCAWCHTNIEPCCGGADAFDEAAATAGIDGALDPQLFQRAFAQSGDAAATVTREALLYALTQLLGSDLDEARLVLEAGERIGAVQPVAELGYRLRRS